MAKLNIAEIQEAMARAAIEPKQQEAVINHLQEVIKELEAEKDKDAPAPKLKNKFGVVTLENGDAALLCQIPEPDDLNSIPDRIRATIKEFNATAKGQKNPVKSVIEAFQVIKPKIFKNNGLIKKSKDITQVIKSENKV